MFGGDPTVSYNCGMYRALITVILLSKKWFVFHKKLGLAMINSRHVPTQGYYL